MKNDLGTRLENVVACALLKKVHLGQDLRGDKSALFYVRDKEKREVDFLTVIDKKIHDLVEVKLSDDNLSKSLAYFASELKPQSAIQLVLELSRETEKGGIPIQKAENFLLSRDNLCEGSLKLIQI